MRFPDLGAKEKNVEKLSWIVINLVSIDEMDETNDNVKSPSQSTFISGMPILPLFCLTHHNFWRPTPYFGDLSQAGGIGFGVCKKAL